MSPAATSAGTAALTASSISGQRTRNTFSSNRLRRLVVALARVARGAGGDDVVEGVPTAARDRQDAVLLEGPVGGAAVGAPSPRLDEGGPLGRGEIVVDEGHPALSPARCPHPATPTSGHGARLGPRGRPDPQVLGAPRYPRHTRLTRGWPRKMLCTKGARGPRAPLGSGQRRRAVNHSHERRKRHAWIKPHLDDRRSAAHHRAPHLHPLRTRRGCRQHAPTPTSARWHHDAPGRRRPGASGVLRRPQLVRVSRRAGCPSRPPRPGPVDRRTGPSRCARCTR